MTDRETYRKMNGLRAEHTHRQSDKETDRDIYGDKCTDKDTYRQTERHTQRLMGWERERHTDR